MGWSTRKGGPVEYLAGDDVLLLQESGLLDISQNNATITLYAVWGATESTLILDANSGNRYNGTALYMDETSKSITNTYQIDRPVGGDNLDLDEQGIFTKNTHFISVNNITLPEGHTVTFDAGEGTLNAGAATTVSAQVHCTGISGSNSSIVNGQLGNVVYNNGYFQSALYTYGPGTQTDTIVFGYDEDPVVLPGASKPNTLFVGWYTDPGFSEGSYVGTEKDGYIPDRNITLYARYSTMDVDITDVYYKDTTDEEYAASHPDEKGVFNNVARDENGFANNAEETRYNAWDTLAVKYETGAVNLSMNIFTPRGYSTAYKAYFKETGTNDWKHFDATSGANGVENTKYGEEFLVPGTDYTFEIKSTGYYRLDAFGGNGQDYNDEKLGGNGGQTYGAYYFLEGDILEIQVGGQGDTATGGGAGTATNEAGDKNLNGGGYSKVVLNRNGSRTTLMIAGGGGSATSKSSGFNGQDSTYYIADQEPSLEGNAGESGYAGGGGGYVGGQKGTVQMGNEEIETTTTYNYKGYVEEYEIPAYGLYKLEVWGAQGGNQGAGGGYGGYASGYIQLNVGDKLYIAVGGSGSSTEQSGSYDNYECYPASGGWNGGVEGTGGGHKDHTSYSWHTYQRASGGGATHIALNTNRGVLQNYNSYRSEILLVAGGGGGAAYNYEPDEDGEENKTWWRSGYPGGDDSHLGWSFGRGNDRGAGGGWIGGAGYDNVGTGGSSYVGGVPAITVGEDTLTPYMQSGVKGGHGSAKITQYKNISDPSYGGSNYVNNDAAIVCDHTYLADSENNGDGKVVIRALAAGFKDGADQYAEIIGAGIPDKAAPSEKVQNMVVDNNNAIGQTVVSWTAPKSMGTSYDFKIELYKTQNASVTNVTEDITTGGVEGIEKDSAADIESTVSRTIESAVAGYYYIFDNEETQNIAAILNSKPATTLNPYRAWYYDEVMHKNIYTNGYTWANNHYEDEQIKYLQKGNDEKYEFSFANTEGWKYLHVAAVDVAGNVGPTEDAEIVTTALARVTFHTNKLKYQLNPATTVEYASSIDDAIGTVPATGMNKQNCYVQYDYAVDGTDIAGAGGYFEDTAGLAFGHEFPSVSAYGCTFLGWNSKSDGTGIWYAQSGVGDGSSYENAKTLVPADVFGDREAGHEITLYAIWSDDATCALEKTYTKTVWTATDGTLQKVETNVNTSESNAVWSNNVTVSTNGQSKASGVWKMWQECATKEWPGEVSQTKAAIVYYPAGALDGTSYQHTFNQFVENFDIEMYGSTTAPVPDSMFNDGIQKLKTTYNLQGTYKVVGVTESRTSADMTVNKIQGKGCVVKSAETTIKVDRTIPSIDSYRVKQTVLSDFSADEVADKIAQGGQMLTKFEARVSDKNNSDNGDFAFETDSAGIEGVYLYVFNAYNYDDSKVYKMPEITRYAENKEKSAAIDAFYRISVDLYSDFPEADKLKFIIYAVDNAGNASKLNEKMYYKTNTDGEQEPGLPDNPEQEGSGADKPGDSWAVGELNNFSIKVVAYNDEDEEYNVNPDNGDVFFQTGDIGHVEVWTVGYTEKINFNFGTLGKEASSAIKDGNLLEKYAMDSKVSEYNETLLREVPYDKGEQIFVNSFTVIDEETGAIINATVGGSRSVKFGGVTRTENELVNDLNDKDGVPYALHFTADFDNQKWWDTGVSIRIPPTHTLEPTGEVDKYNSPIYKNEVHVFQGIAKKGTSETASSNSLVIWDMGTNDVHYRVIHEN